MAGITFKGGKAKAKRKDKCKNKRGFHWDASVGACVPNKKTLIERFGK